MCLPCEGLAGHNQHMFHWHMRQWPLEQNWVGHHTHYVAEREEGQKRREREGEREGNKGGRERGEGGK